MNATIFKIDYFFILLGVSLAVISLMSFRDQANPKRVATGSFWALYALAFLGGELMPPMIVGVIVVVMALIAGLGGVAMGKYQQFTHEERKTSAQKLGNRLLYPALIIPFVTMLGSVVFATTKIGDMYLLDQKNFTLASLGVGCIIALIAACQTTKSNPVQSMREARRLIDSMGWAVVLPQMLAVLGLLFMDAGVGKAVAKITTTYISMDFKLVAVSVYCLGMALFTMIMGNAFAAFPVMAGGVGIPILIGVFHGNPAIIAAIGMFSGYCGTLMTPMAANFNIVPAALLDLPDKNAVVKVQIMTALPLLIVNVFLMYFLMNAF
ncbi:MAG: DUF979 domain-containing protein [Betaproteobacteria bacterium]